MIKKDNLIKNIVFISNNYPGINNMKYTFVEQVINEIESKGIECTVIAPQSITNNIFRELKMMPLKTIVPNKNITIFRPFYITFSNILPNINRFLFIKTVEKCFKKISNKPDVIYGHFIKSAGIAAVEIGKRYNIPSYIASGESTFNGLEGIKREYLKNIFRVVNGIISVSSENKNYLLKKDLISKDKIILLPNAINEKIFYKRNKIELRKKYGIEEKDFIVIFVGSFIKRKGSARLADALKKVKNVNSIFIGKGTNIPECPGIIHRGPVLHEKIPEYLSIADVFVLPTLAEGCCNAIIEAMACSLPIISSNLPFNDDLLNQNNSIRINPNSIEEIAEAIKILRDNKVLREKMAKESELEGKKYLISNRVSKVIEFISNNINS